MPGSSKLDAWCPSCEEVRTHTLVDPGSCTCDVCGHVEQMLKPLGPKDELDAGGKPGSRPAPGARRA